VKAKEVIELLRRVGEWWHKTQYPPTGYLSGGTISGQYFIGKNEANEIAALIQSQQGEIERLQKDLNHTHFQLGEACMKIAEYEHSDLREVKKWSDGLKSNIEQQLQQAQARAKKLENVAKAAKEWDNAIATHSKILERDREDGMFSMDLIAAVQAVGRASDALRGKLAALEDKP
jgi:chromosome segregation ATPase